MMVQVEVISEEETVTLSHTVMKINFDNKVYNTVGENDTISEQVSMPLPYDVLHQVS